MTPMLATIDDTTARKVDEDRKIHGVGYLRVNADGLLEHVPISDLELLGLTARVSREGVKLCPWEAK